MWKVGDNYAYVKPLTKDTKADNNSNKLKCIMYDNESLTWFDLADEKEMELMIAQTLHISEYYITLILT